MKRNKIRASQESISLKKYLLLCCGLWVSLAFGHTQQAPVVEQAQQWLSSLGDKSVNAHFDFQAKQRFDYNWLPGNRAGIRLDQLDDSQRDALGHLLQAVLSDTGHRKVDAIIATEAALGVISGSRSYRDPNKYFTAIFGSPGTGVWAMRFEGHHLSVNLTFRDSQIISASPLFLGANPETVSEGPDKGLRALAAEVDQGKALFESFTKEQEQIARGSDEWFAGFLTDPGDRRVAVGKPAGIAATALLSAQQNALKMLIAEYVNTISAEYASPYLEQVIARDWANVHFFWKGSAADGENFYYRIAGQQLLIEHDSHAGSTHVHSIWRDAVHDFTEQ